MDRVGEGLSIRAQAERVLAVLVTAEGVLRPVEKLADCRTCPEDVFALLVSVQESHVDLPAAVGVDAFTVMAVIEAVVAGQFVVGIFLEKEDILDLAFTKLPGSRDVQCDRR